MQTAINSILITRVDLTFTRDMPGFIGARHFELEPLGEGSEGVFARLTCTDTLYLNGETPLEKLSLLVMTPGILWPNYEVHIDEIMTEELGLSRAEDAMLLVIVHPREPLSQSSANLYSPIVVNRHTGLADQLVPPFSERESGWSVRTPFPADGED